VYGGLSARSRSAKILVMAKKQRKMKKEIAKPEMFANVFSGNRLASIEKNLA
jgi:hypothetical protein